MHPAYAQSTGKLYQTEIAVRKFFVVADEPTDLGGGDTGPTPHELVECALSACTLITLQMYMARKGWELPAPKVWVDAVSHPKDGYEYLFTCKIEVEGANEEQRKRLLEIAAKCPIHRMLKGTNKLVTTWEAGLTREG